jgi:hypothetical protein
VNEQHGTLHTKENTWLLGVIHFRFPIISREPTLFKEKLLCKLYQIPRLIVSLCSKMKKNKRKSTLKNGRGCKAEG